MTSSSSLNSNPQLDSWLRIHPDGQITIFSGKVTVTARIDQNADADSSLGDIQGRVDAEVGNGEKVNIVIDNILGG